jgi:hypothetical protein
MFLTFFSKYTLNSASFDIHKPYNVKKFDHYVLHGPKSHDLYGGGLLAQKLHKHFIANFCKAKNCVDPLLDIGNVIGHTVLYELQRAEDITDLDSVLGELPEL